MEQQEKETEILDGVRSLSKEFEARAEETDRGGPGNSLLLGNIRALAKIGYFGAKIRSEDGGLALPAWVNTECSELLASACGVTTFTQQQIHSGAYHVARSADEQFKAKTIPALIAGDQFCGIAFSHLRRPGAPSVLIEKVSDGYLVTGEAPWVTGWSFLSSFVLAGRDPSGATLYVYVPIEESRSRLIVSQPLKVSAMEAGDTVKVGFNSLVIPENYMLFESEPDYLEKNDVYNITGPVYMPLGCVRGCMRQLQTLAEKNNKPIFSTVAHRLEKEANDIRARARHWSAAGIDEPGYKENALAARSDAIQLAMRAAQSCIAACSGSAHLLTNPAQRRHREASFYATVAQTEETQRAFLESITHE